MSVRITRCVCFDKTFAELKAIAQREGATTIDQLQARIDFGFNCKLCHPYVRRMLRTGETEFHELLQNPPESPKN